MNRKIIDIFPPKELKERVKEVLPKRERELKPLPSRGLLGGRWEGCSPFKKSLTLLLVILFGGGIFCHFALNGAEIEIWPEAEILTFETKLTVDKEIDKSDFSAKIIPGKIFEAEKTVSEEFPSSGKILKEERAEGIIRVYNAYSVSPQVLIATTRFVSADGKLFRSVDRVTIPGGHYEEGKFIPGFLDIKVRADQPGPEYNIGPSTFSIPGFAGTARYTAFYGKSFQAMEGGLREEVSKVTQEDLDRARDALIEKAELEGKEALKNKIFSEAENFFAEDEQIASEFGLLEDAIETEILETFSLAATGVELETFVFQVKSKSKTLAFKSEDLQNFAISSISSQILPNKKLYLESLKINYSPESVDLEAGRITLSLEMEAKIYSDIDETSLKNGLVGKSLREAQIFLENQPQITQVQGQLQPFWLKRIPEDIEKIEIKLNLD